MSAFFFVSFRSATLPWCTHTFIYTQTHTPNFGHPSLPPCPPLHPHPWCNTSGGKGCMCVCLCVCLHCLSLSPQRKRTRRLPSFRFPLHACCWSIHASGCFLWERERGRQSIKICKCYCWSAEWRRVGVLLLHLLTSPVATAATAAATVTTSTSVHPSIHVEWGTEGTFRWHSRGRLLKIYLKATIISISSGFPPQNPAVDRRIYQRKKEGNVQLFR